MNAVIVFCGFGVGVSVLFLCFSALRRQTTVPEAVSTSITGAVLGGLVPGLVLRLDLKKAVTELSCVTSVAGAVALFALTLATRRSGSPSATSSGRQQK